jgi:lipoyl(octanoyl) transferase
LNLVSVTDIGRTRYADAWRLQQKLWKLRHSKAIGDKLLFTEHDHVYTVGKGGDSDHVLASDDELKRTGVDFFQIDRGGDVTYHGPGQIVGYPIIDLSNYTPDLHKYLRDLEEVIIVALRKFDIEGTREKEFTGVWVKGEKIAAIGVKVSRWITMHGFALNVNTDLTKFARIIPCGIFHKGVASVQSILGRAVEMEAARRALSEAFGSIFGCEIRTMRADELAAEIAGTEAEQKELTGGVA